MGLIRFIRGRFSRSHSSEGNEVDCKLNEAFTIGYDKSFERFKANIAAAEMFLYINPSRGYDKWQDIICDRYNCVFMQTVDISNGVTIEFKRLSNSYMSFTENEKSALLDLLSKKIAGELLIDANGDIISDVPIGDMLATLSDAIVERYIEDVKNSRQAIANVSIIFSYCMNTKSGRLNQLKDILGI